MIAVVAVCSYLLGVGLPLPANASVAALAACSVIAWRHQPLRWWPPLVAPVAVLLVATAASTAFSIDLRRSLVLSAPLVPGTLLFLLLARHRDGRIVPIVFATAAVVTLGLSTAVMAAAARGDWPSLHSRVAVVGTPLLVEANDIALVAVLAPCACAVIVSPSSRRWRWAGVLSLIAGVLAICLLRSRTAFLTLLVGIASFAWLTTRSPRDAWKVVAALLVGAAIADAGLGFRLSTKFRQFRDQRIALALTTTHMFVDAPVLGHGPHSFATLSARYREATTLPRWVPPLRQSHVWAHNLYLEFLAERGIAGLVALLVVLSVAFRRLAAIRRGRDPVVSLHSAAVTASLAAFCVAALFESSFLRLWVVVVFFTLLGIAAQLSHERSQSW